MCWAVYLLCLISYWQYQHQLIIDTFAPYGAQRLTLICLLIVMALLPYSLSHKLHIDIHLYALCFTPPIILLTLIANEKISVAGIIAAILMGCVFLLLINKKGRLSLTGYITGEKNIRFAHVKSALRFRAVNSNLWILILLMVYSITFSNTDELTHYHHAIRHYLDTQQWDKALEVGKQSTSTDSTLFGERAEALIMTNQLGEKLFSYPIPTSGAKISIIKPFTAKQMEDVLLCNLLLRRELGAFASALPKCYDLHSRSLPKHYKEALVVYLSQSVSTSLVYTDVITEANYADFLTEKKKYNNSIEAYNMCQSLYGDTYFWYYFFFKPNRNYDKQSQN